MFEFLKNEAIPDEELIEIWQLLTESLEEQLSMAASSENFERNFSECLQSGYLIGYISGLATAFGANACTESNIKKSAYGENIQRLYDAVVYNAFPKEQYQNYKNILIEFIANKTTAFHRGEYDGMIDSKIHMESGEFAKYLAGRLITLGDPRDDLFILSFTELSELALSGDPDAQLEMATRYSKGRGVEESMQKAASLYILSTLGGHPHARPLCLASLQCLSSSQRNEVRKTVESFEFQANPKTISEALDELFERTKAPKERICIDNIDAFFHTTYQVKYIATGFPPNLINDPYIFGYLLGITEFTRISCGYEKDDIVKAEICNEFAKQLFHVSLPNAEVLEKITSFIMDDATRDAFESGYEESMADISDVSALISAGLTPEHWILKRFKESTEKYGIRL